jgi:hypothetical protein
MSKFLLKFECLSRGDLVAASLIHTAQAGPSAKAMEELMSVTPSKSSKAAAAAADGSKQGQGKKGKKKGTQQAEEEEEAAAAGGQQDLGVDGDWGTGLGAYEAAYGDKGGQQVQQLPKTLHIQDAMRTLTQEFYKRMPGAKCQNCGCLNPSIKKQGSSKLFKQYSRRALLQNFARGIDVAAAVTGGAAAAAAAMDRLREAGAAAAGDADGDSDEEEEDEKKGAAAAATAADSGKKRKRAAAAGAEQQAGSKKQGLAGDAFEGGSKPVPAVIKKQLQEQEDWVSAVLGSAACFCTRFCRLRVQFGSVVCCGDAGYEHQGLAQGQRSSRHPCSSTYMSLVRVLPLLPLLLLLPSSCIPAPVQMVEEESEEEEDDQQQQPKAAAAKAAKAGGPGADAAAAAGKRPGSKASAKEAAMAQQLGKQINL